MCCSIILISLVILQGLVSAESAPLSIEEAKTLVCNFAGEDIEFSRIDRSAPHEPIDSYRLLDRQQGMYTVDRKIRTVILFSRGDRRRPTTKDEMNAWEKEPDITRERAIALATEFAKKRYRGFEEKDMQLASAVLSPDEWQIEFVQRLPENNARTGNIIYMGLSRKDGTIWSYIANYWDVPAECHRQPKLSETDAKKVYETLSGLKNITFQGVELACGPNGRLDWALVGRGIGADGQPQGQILNIDADTGELTGKGVSGGKPAGTKPPATHKRSQNSIMPMIIVCAVIGIWTFWVCGSIYQKHR